MEKENERTSYHVVVDKSLGVEGLLKAVEADGYVNPDITNPEFRPPIKGTERYETDIELIGIPRAMPEESVVVYLEGLGYDPALPEDTLALGAQHKYIKREPIIICVGGFWYHPAANRLALVLGGSSHDRCVNLYWRGYLEPWDRGTRVAAVLKRNATLSHSRP